jgi:hypothetical protein
MKKMVLFLLLLSAGFLCADAQEKDISTITVSPQCNGKVVVPVGVFHEIAPIGMGLEVNVGIKDLLFKKSALKLCTGYDFISEEIEGVNSFGIMSLSAFAGYSIFKNNIFLVTPLLGFGYMGHVIEEESYNLFFDPYIAVQSEFDVLLWKGFNVSLTPSFLFFFEQNNVGSYMSVQLGVKQDFTVEVGGNGHARNKSLPELPHIGIERNRAAFSPDGDGNKDTIDLRVIMNKELPVTGFVMNIVDNSNTCVKTYPDTQANHTLFNWDGKNSDGGIVADGIYSAKLTVVYHDGREQEVKSDDFIVDTTPPDVRLTISPDLFSPDGDGINDTLYIRCYVKELSEIEHMEIIVYNPKGNIFRSFHGPDYLRKEIMWDGKSNSGELVESVSKYPLTLSATDEAGNRTSVNDTIRTDILIGKYGNTLKLIISNIHFEAYSHDCYKGPHELVEENRHIINRLSDLLKRFKTYDLVIEGHAFNQYWDDKIKAEREEKVILIPLSKARADNIRKMLVKLGIDAHRIQTVGRGSSEPIVPFGDRENNWKNRRVEIILKKN